MRTASIKLNGKLIAVYEVLETEQLTPEEQLLQAIFGKQYDDPLYDWLVSTK